MNIKKKLLFIINNLNVGGSEKALISLLNELDYSQFEVDLQLFTRTGLFLKDVPKEVNILPVPEHYHFFDGSFKKALKTGQPKLIYNRYKFSTIIKKSKIPAEREQLAWRFLSKALKVLDKNYDVAIGYLEKNPIYYAIDKTKAKKKIGFIHNDYKNIEVNAKLDEPYFKKLDYICSVSQHCVDILKEVFPHYSDKIKLVPNLFSENLISKKSIEPLEVHKFDKSVFNILSVGRLAEQKAFHLAVEAAKLLKDNGFAFNWYILGEGHLRSILEKRINELKLNDSFFLLGNQQNPYNFMYNSDLIVQTSLFEGKSIAIDEAKLLNKIILTTNYPTVCDQIKDKIEGYICGFSPSEIANSIIKISYLIENNNKIKEYLNNHKQSNINKLLELL